MTDERLIEVIKILKSHGIEMWVSGCGCCESPHVFFEYKGRKIIEDGDASFDTTDFDENGNSLLLFDEFGRVVVDERGVALKKG